jgi:hypothetical protein
MKKKFIISGINDLRSVMVDAWNFLNSIVQNGSAISVTVDTISKRSAEANKLMWVRLGELERQATWDDRYLNAEEWKDLLSAGLFQCKVIQNIGRTGFVCVGLRTSEFTIQQMNDMICLIEAFGSERGVQFSANPHDIEIASKGYSHE